ncbi:hypothetical protein Tco_1223440, partial [Tanacetum coccineum]
MEGISFSEPPSLIRIPEKQNLKFFYDYHRDRGYNTNDCYQLKKQIKEAVASGKLAHLVRDIRRSNQKSGNQRRNDVKVINMIDEGRNHKRPYEEEIPGLTEELTFPAIPLKLPTSFNTNVQSRLRKCKASLVGFSSERYHPLGLIDLWENWKSVGLWKKHNDVITWNKCQEYGNKYWYKQGTTLNRGLVRNRFSWESMIGKIVIASMLSVNCKQQLIDVLRKNVDVFASLGRIRKVSRYVIRHEHQLKAYLAKQVDSKEMDQRLLTLDSMKEKVLLLKEGIIRRVYGGRRIGIANGIPIQVFLMASQCNRTDKNAEDDERKLDSHTREKEYTVHYMQRIKFCSNTLKYDGK